MKKGKQNTGDVDNLQIQKNSTMIVYNVNF